MEIQFYYLCCSYHSSSRKTINIVSIQVPHGLCRVMNIEYLTPKFSSIKDNSCSPLRAVIWSEITICHVGIPNWRSNHTEATGLLFLLFHNRLKGHSEDKEVLESGTGICKSNIIVLEGLHLPSIVLGSQQSSPRIWQSPNQTKLVQCYGNPYDNEKGHASRQDCRRALSWARTSPPMCHLRMVVECPGTPQRLCQRIFANIRQQQGEWPRLLLWNSHTSLR